MSRSLRVLIVCLSLAPLAPQSQAQSQQGYGDDPFAQPLEEMAESIVTVAPQLRFSLLGEISLPGPLPGKGPLWVDGMVEIPVAVGVAVVSAEVGGMPFVESREVGPEFDPAPWSVNENGRRRFLTLEDGRVQAEGRCDKCDSGWKKRWRLRVPGNSLAVPLVHDRRVFFGAMNNLIYCVKARNGHQVWTNDVGGRPSRPLVMWPRGPAASLSRKFALTPTAVLVVLGAGTELLALDGRTGQRVARVALERGRGTLIGVPLTTPDGRIVVAYQGYDESEAALRIYNLDQPGMRAPIDLGEPDPAPEVEIEDEEPAQTPAEP